MDNLNQSTNDYDQYITLTVDDDNYEELSSVPNNITTLIWKADTPFVYYPQFEELIEFKMMTDNSITDLIHCRNLIAIELLGDYDLCEEFDHPMPSVTTLTIGESYIDSFDIVTNFPNVEILTLGFYSTLYRPFQPIDPLFLLQRLKLIVLKRGSISTDELSQFADKEIDYVVDEKYSILSDLAKRNPMLPGTNGINLMIYALEESKEQTMPDVYYAVFDTDENRESIHELDELIASRGGLTRQQINQIVDPEFNVLSIGDPGNKSYYKDRIPYLADPVDIRDYDLKNIVDIYKSLQETSIELFIKGDNYREYDRVMYMIWNFRNGITVNVDSLEYRIELKDELEKLLQNEILNLYEFTRSEMIKVLRNIDNYKRNINIYYTEAQSVNNLSNEEFRNICSAYTTYINILEITQNEYNTWIPIYKVRKERATVCARELILLENEIKQINRRRQIKRNATIRPMSIPISQRGTILIRRNANI
jgi:hypothetical protein